MNKRRSSKNDPSYQETIRLFRLGMKPKDIAAKQGISPSAAWSRCNTYERKARAYSDFNPPSIDADNLSIAQAVSKYALWKIQSGTKKVWVICDKEGVDAFLGGRAYRSFKKYRSEALVIFEHLSIEEWIGGE